jgi:hypothetical protein
VQGLSSPGVAFAEGHPVGQGFEVGAVEVHLELIARLRMEARLDIGSGDGGVDIHDEHGAAVACKHVQVIDVELAILGCERRIKMMRHVTVLRTRWM